ncbi:MAG: hypothetical protein R2715_07750 [Ilumatobacteraceae bacterium]
MGRRVNSGRAASPESVVAASAGAGSPLPEAVEAAGAAINMKALVTASAVPKCRAMVSFSIPRARWCSPARAPDE